MKRFIAGVLFVVCSVAPWMVAQQASDPATPEDVRQFLTLMHIRDQMTTMIDGLMDQIASLAVEQFKKEHPQATEEEVARVQDAATTAADKAKKTFPLDELLDAVIPIYQKHLTHGDIVAVSAFYSSPAGQKFVKEAPQMMTEGMQAGKEVMERQVPAIQKEVESAANSALNQQAAPN